MSPQPFHFWHCAPFVESAPIYAAIHSIGTGWSETTLGMPSAINIHMLMCLQIRPGIALSIVLAAQQGKAVY